MQKLKITLNEDGSVYQFTPDFKIMRGSYRNVLINIEVPHSLLLDPAKDESGENQTGNDVRVGAIIKTVTGKNITTKGYKFQRVKDFTREGVDYRLYQRKIPKIFTMWDTVSEQEATEGGKLTLVINVINWLINDLNAKIEEISASPKFTLEIHPSDLLEEEEIDEPSDFDELHSQVQEMDAEIDELQSDLYGEDGLGEFLTSRLKAGNKITLEKVDGQIKVSVQTIKASEVPIDAITDMKASDVQRALEELSKRTDSQQVDTLTGEDDYLVDNTDPRNPIIMHDKSKVDKSSIVDNLTTEDANKVLSANQGAILKKHQDTLETSLISEENGRKSADNDLLDKINAEATTRQTNDNNLQSQVNTLESVKASKTEMQEAIASAISAVVNSAPEAFDTLKEIADWIEQDEAGSSALVLRVSAIETKNTEQDTALANETNARQTADNTLQSNIDTEANARQSADTTLQGNIDAEASARESAINSLKNSKLDNVTIEGGTNNGTIKVTKVINGTSSSVDNIPVTGLKSAAFKESSAFATAEQGKLAESAVQEETDPTVPAWAKNASKPTYTADEVGALPSNTTYVSSVNGESGAITGIATETFVANAIQEAIGNAIGGAY